MTSLLLILLFSVIYSRSANKTENIIKVLLAVEPVEDRPDFPYIGDQVYLGLDMAAKEINAQSDILPDATIELHRTNISSRLDAGLALATLGTICEQRQYHLVVGPILSENCLTTGIACSYYNVPQFSTRADDGALSDTSAYDSLTQVWIILEI